MTPPDEAERIARARVIVSYRFPARDNSGERDALLEEAGVSGSYKNWMNTKRPYAPSLDELLALAQAFGVPRKFAERGFEELWEAGEEARAREAIRARSVAALAARTSLEAVQGDDRTQEASPSKSRAPDRRKRAQEADGG